MQFTVLYVGGTSCPARRLCSALFCILSPLLDVPEVVIHELKVPLLVKRASEKVATMVHLEHQHAMVFCKCHVPTTQWHVGVQSQVSVPSEIHNFPYVLHHASGDPFARVRVVCVTVFGQPLGRENLAKPALVPVRVRRATLDLTGVRVDIEEDCRMVGDRIFAALRATHDRP